MKKKKKKEERERRNFVIIEYIFGTGGRKFISFTLIYYPFLKATFLCISKRKI
jgi:hypothetical protein